MEMFLVKENIKLWNKLEFGNNLNNLKLMIHIVYMEMIQI